MTTVPPVMPPRGQRDLDRRPKFVWQAEPKRAKLGAIDRRPQCPVCRETRIFHSFRTTGI